MADTNKGKGKGKSKGGSPARTGVLAALLGVVALLALWLNDCIPGMGSGKGSDDAKGDSEKQADETPKASEKADANPDANPDANQKAEPTLAAPAPARLVVDGRGCALVVDGEPGEAVACASLCESEDPFGGATEVVIDATQGPHGDVMAASDCAKDKGLKIAINRE